VQKRIPYYIMSVLLALSITGLWAQVNVKAIVPEKPVIIGEPFRIQFVIENASANQRFSAPDFNWLKIVRGPETYAGTQTINGQKTDIVNYIYTAVAEQEGKYRIGHASVKINGLSFISNEVIIVAAKKQKQNSFNNPDGISVYTLLPGEDAYRKIKENLFVKLFVDRKTCFVGEPVVATFKLFSRLQSKSDIVKNPGFYGFSVYDMVNLDDKIKETERVNGKDFDVHTIRKVQLYPLQPGVFTIDEMKVDNKVEFSQSMVNKKTEQQISEGVLNENNDESATPGTEIFETSLVTEPVRITVKALPQNNKPEMFNGATGAFTIRSKISDSELDKNEEGFLEIIVEGKGNFTQLTAPVIQWPKEIEGFEPTVKNFLDKRIVPLSGGRIFRYPFISSVPGKWKIPSVKFSYFNTGANSYKTIGTDSAIVSISEKEFKKITKHNTPAGERKVSMEDANKRVSKIAFALVVLAITGTLGYWLLQGRKKKKVIMEEPVVKEPTVEEIFNSIAADESVPARDFYTSVYNAAWSWLSQHLHLSGTEMNKSFLQTRLKLSGMDESAITELLNHLNYIETAMFTSVEMESSRSELVEKTISVLNNAKG
jgi:BatD DUF11 like domain